MTAQRRSIHPGDLLFGDDHDFVINAYIALLGRWPDAAGYTHYTQAIANRPERRVEVLQALADSAEARRPGRPGPGVVFPEGPILPSDPRQALAVALDLRTGFLVAEMARMREALDLLGGPGGPQLAGLGSALLEAREAEIRSDIAALRRDMQERFEGLAGAAPGMGGAVATAEERIAEALARTLADYVGDMIAVAEARFEARLRSLEARVAALGVRVP
jgi:hypothetical protein